MRFAGLVAAIVIGVVPRPAATQVVSDNPGPVAWWGFDGRFGRIAYDRAGRFRDVIRGRFERIDGVTSSALKFDGFSARVIRTTKNAPHLGNAFTIEAWVAPQAYPWNWCAVVNQESDREEGYFFGIDATGRVGLHLSVRGEWRECVSRDSIPFMAWSHIAATFEATTGIAVYINGQAAGELPVRGMPDYARGADLLIGRNSTDLPPVSLVRKRVSFPASYSFDGIIDEVKVYDRALSPERIAQAYEARKPAGDPPLKWRKLPRLPVRSDRFGASHTRLKFYPEWDALWRVGDHPDVVVGFEESPYKMVFWRGTNYNMNLVTENGRWVSDQSAEGGGGDVIGCCEHMSDKQCRYAHVRVIENHDARVVVHWRYALCDVLYRIAKLKEGGPGAWADEYYYIYPDGAAVRSFAVYNVGGCSITEPTVLNQPGEKAEDHISLDAVTMANMEGQTRTHSWKPWPSNGRTGAPFTNALPDANICLVNLKSRYKPFYIYEPGTSIIPYGGGTRELREDYSRFPTWNHWPVSQVASDGRYALAPDRVASSAITSPEPPMKRRKEDGALVGRFIMGLTDKTIDSLAPLARSWLEPPQLAVLRGAYVSEGYSRDQRAYVLRKKSEVNMPIDVRVAASNDSPLINPAFVVKNWGETAPQLKLNGRGIERGRDFRFGHDHRLEGSDLVVWLKTEVTRPVTVSIIPAGYSGANTPAKPGK